MSMTGREALRDAGLRSSVARILRCESSEDGDGATGGLYSKSNSGRMPDPLQFAFDLEKKNG